MKTFLNLALVLAAVVLAGCVGTVTENQPGLKPAYQDRLEGRYLKSVDEVFEAAKRALNSFGTVSSEGKVLTGSNQVRVAEGEINGRRIYVRIEEIDPQVTGAIVQVRTRMGGTDLRIAKDLIRRIAVELE